MVNIKKSDVVLLVYIAMHDPIIYLIGFDHYVVRLRYIYINMDIVYL